MNIKYTKNGKYHFTEGFELETVETSVTSDLIRKISTCL